MFIHQAHSWLLKRVYIFIMAEDIAGCASQLMTLSSH